MPSAKILAQKQADLGALVEKIKGAQSGVLVDYTGITVEQDTKLRASFRTSGVDYKVYKNTMTSRACDEVGYAEMKELLKGMTAFALSTEDPIAPARIAKKFADDIETFDIKGGKEAAFKFIDKLQIFSLLANVADVKSLVIHPATTTHSQLTAEELEDQGIHQGTIRLSIGTENINDILADLEQAFN